MEEMLMAGTTMEDTVVLITCQLFGCSLIYGAYYIFIKPTPPPKYDPWSYWDIEHRWHAGHPLWQERNPGGGETGSDSEADDEEPNSEKEEKKGEKEERSYSLLLLLFLLLFLLPNKDAYLANPAPKPDADDFDRPYSPTYSDVMEGPNPETPLYWWGSGSDVEEEEITPPIQPPPSREEIREEIHVATLASAEMEGTLFAHTQAQRDSLQRIDKKIREMKAEIRDRTRNEQNYRVLMEQKPRSRSKENRDEEELPL